VPWVLKNHLDRRGISRLVRELSANRLAFGLPPFAHAAKQPMNLRK